jgi:hypothetical protein
MLIVVPFFHPIITDSFAKVNNRTPGRGLSGGSTSGGSTSGGSASGGSTSGGSTSGGSTSGGSTSGGSTSGGSTSGGSTSGGSGGGTTTGVINGNDPASASSLLCGSNTITFGSVVQGYGERTVYINGSSAAGGFGFQAICVGTTTYVYNLYNPAWYQWTGSSWSAIGQAPPGQAGVTAIPILAGANCCSGTGDAPWYPWVATSPYYSDSESQGGPAQGYAPSNCGVVYGPCSSYPTGAGFVDMTWDSFGGSGGCAYPNGYVFPQTYAGWQAAATAMTNGSQTAAIDNYITTFLVPMAANIAYIRVAHEWNGNWFCTSPWTGTNESTALLTPAQWMGIQQVMVTEIQKLLLPHNTHIGIYQDAPSDPTQANYGLTVTNMAAQGLGPGTAGYPNGTCYQGAACINMTGSDFYVGSTCAGTACGLTAFQNSFNGNQYYYNKEYGLTWAAQNDLPVAFPEWADSTNNSSYATGAIITNFVNLFASLQGPGNFKVVAVSYWDNESDCTGCGLGDFPAYKPAYAQAWPNGFYGTTYNTTTGWWGSNIHAMLCPNFWIGSGNCPIVP